MVYMMMVLVDVYNVIILAQLALILRLTVYLVLQIHKEHFKVKSVLAIKDFTILVG